MQILDSTVFCKNFMLYYNFSIHHQVVCSRYMDYGNKEEQLLSSLRPFEDYKYYDEDVSIDLENSSNCNNKSAPRFQPITFFTEMHHGSGGSTGPMPGQTPRCANMSANAFCNASGGRMGEGVGSGNEASGRNPITGLPFNAVSAGEAAAMEQEMMNGLPLIPPPPPISSATVTNDQVHNICQVFYKFSK